MSEKRKLSQIQEDYQRLCLKAGHLQYQINALSKDLDLVNQTLRDLNLEAATAASEDPMVKVPKDEAEPATSDSLPTPEATVVS